MKKVFQILCLIIVTISCEEEVPTPDYVNPFEDLERKEYLLDTRNKLLLYNGNSRTIVNGKITLGSDEFGVNTSDSKLEMGKAYDVTLGEFEFKLYVTELPILSISTNNQEIKDDPKAAGNLRLLEKDQVVFESVIGIELRGGVSQYHPKKSYSVELWADESGTEKRKESLLGMREDDDWIMDGLWNEPIRIRDFTAHDIWKKMGTVKGLPNKGELSIDRRYCELFINDTYKGLYYLGEKFDRKQLDLKEYDGQVQGELYKGFVWADAVTYDGIATLDNNKVTWSGYEAKFPKDVGELDWNLLYDHVYFVVKSSKAEFDAEIAAKIDMENAVNYYIFMNYMTGEDNRGKNVYTGKIDNTSSYFFLPWDLDGTFGNDWRGERVDLVNIVISNGLYKRLLQYPPFVSLLKQRWTELRTNVLEKNSIRQLFRDNYSYLARNAVYERESLVKDLTQNYSTQEIEYLESYIDRRSNFLDTYFNGL